LLSVQHRSHVCPRAGLILPGTETGPPETAVSLPAMNDDTARGNTCLPDLSIIDTLFPDWGLEKHVQIRPYIQESMVHLPVNQKSAWNNFLSSER